MNEQTHIQFELALGRNQHFRIEWPTVALLIACYTAWTSAGLLYAVAPWIAVPLLALPIVLHSSLQHEAIHRHPTSSEQWNEALVFLPLGLLYPYRRYRETHLRHHVDSRLTDPYDDPESFYLAHGDHRRLPRAARVLLAWNATLAGRIVIGPLIAAIRFLRGEARAAARLRGTEARAWRTAWSLHILGCAAVVAIIDFVFGVPIVAYFGAVYLALALLGVRAFCEHRWDEAQDARTVIVEQSWLGWLFLHNNLHLVHHKQPHLPWYALPRVYQARRAEWLALNNGYAFEGYRAVLRAYALRAKEPVVHPTYASHTVDMLCRQSIG